MPTKPPSFYGSCARKSAYKTEKKANRYARKMEKKYGSPMRSYFCGVCGQWHLTTVRSLGESIPS